MAHDDEWLLKKILKLLDSSLNDMANLRMIDWPDELGTAHPRTFIAEDYDTLMKCKALFARKFDSKVDSKIIKLICQSLENG